MIKAVIFDMDGVLIDSEPIYKSVDLKLFEKYGLDLNQIEIEDYIGVNLFEMWEELNEKYNLEIENVKAVVEDHLKHFYFALKNKENLELMPGVLKWIKNFKENDLKMIIASSSFPLIVDYIYQRFNLDNYMSGYIDVYKIENGKPDPEIFLKAAQELKVDPSECLVIEDSEHGITAADRAGIKSVAFKQREDAKQDLTKASLVINEFNSKNLKAVKELYK